MTTEQTRGNGGNPNQGSETPSGMTRAVSEGSSLERRDPLAAAFEGPFALMSRLIQDMDRLFYGMSPLASRSWLAPQLEPQQWRPAVDVTEQDDRLIVVADLPGLHRENVDVEIRNGQLVISGERRNESEQRQGEYRMTERSYGKFAREVPLPEGVNPDDISARFEDGVLRIEIPVPATMQRQRRQIPIR